MAAKNLVSSVFRPGLFIGKSAIVTGGGTGIGKAISHELLHLGTLSKSHMVKFSHDVHSSCYVVEPEQ